jgi:hypothetical protein
MANQLGITWEQIEKSYEGTLPSTKIAWAQQKIDEAVRDLLSFIPSIPDRIASNKLDADLVRDKVAAAALRVVRNPMGIESEDEGDYGLKLRNTVASGDIWWQEKDLIALGRVKPSQRNRPRTVFARSSRGFGAP